MTSIALITGNSGGFGRTSTPLLLAQGCWIVNVGRDTGRLADVQAAVRLAASALASAAGDLKG